MDTSAEQSDPPESTTGTQLSQSSVEDTFSVLTSCVCRFIDAWEAEQNPPDISTFLPTDETLRRLVLPELIKADLEFRWVRFSVPQRIHEYQQQFPELSGDGLPPDLIYEEFLIRRQAGLEIEPREYLQEFPGHAAALEPLFGLGGKFQSTVIVNRDEVRALDAVEAGQTLDDFELLSPLGRGAFAKVYLARQKSMQRLVAVKVSADSGTEPQTLARLDHDYIVRVFDQRIIPGDGLRLLYMQYVPGGTLLQVVRFVREQEPRDRSGQALLDVVDQALEKKGEIRPAGSSLRRELARCSWPEAVAWVGSRLARGLGYAHRLGVLHRDVKPANVLLTGEAEPKLADFNISFSEQVSGATPAAYFGGSLAYMSPEQLEAFHPLRTREAGDLDRRSDIYALAVLLWELLTGARPFEEESIAGDWHRTLDQMIADRQRGITAEQLARLPDNCPATLRRVLGTALAPDPEDRWQSADEFARQLDISLDADARDLIDPRSGARHARLLKWAALILLLYVLIPNALLGAYNFAYNHKEMEDNASELMPSFMKIVGVVNPIAFPVGIGLGIGLAVRVAGAARRVASKRGPPLVNPHLRRVECLRVGEYACVICLGLWTVSGVAYPIALRAMEGPLPLWIWVHFIVSLAICGLVAIAWPFFLVTSFSVRTLYPVFVREGQCDDSDTKELTHLSARVFRYLGVSAAVPLVALLGLIGDSVAHPGQDVNFRVMIAVCFGGLLGLVFSYVLYRRLDRDLTALRRVIVAGGDDAGQGRAVR